VPAGGKHSRAPRYVPATPGSPAAAGADPKAKSPHAGPSHCSGAIVHHPGAIIHLPGAMMRQAAPAGTWDAKALPAFSGVGCTGGVSGCHSSPCLPPSSAGHAGSQSCSSWTDTARRPVLRCGVSRLSGTAAGRCHQEGSSSPPAAPSAGCWGPRCLPLPRGSGKTPVAG